MFFVCLFVLKQTFVSTIKIGKLIENLLPLHNIKIKFVHSNQSESVINGCTRSHSYIKYYISIYKYIHITVLNIYFLK